MRRWMRVLLVGVLSLLLSIDSASACRFLRNRCRPRCRTVTCHRPRSTAVHCRPVACATTTCGSCCVSGETIVVETAQCCVPADGSAHAEIAESASQPLATTPTTDTLKVPTPTTPQPTPATPSMAAEKPAPVAPVETPLPPLEPAVAPASAQEPVAQPQFKTAKEILAESAAEKAAESAEQVLAAEKAAEQPAPAPEEKPALDLPAEESPAEKTPAPKPEPEEVEPAAEPAVEKPAPKKPAEPEEENLFDEAENDSGNDSEPALVPVSDDAEPVPAAGPTAADDLFGEPPARETPAAEPAAEPAEDVPAAEPADAKEEPAEEPAAEPAAEKEETKEPAAEDDPFAGILEAPHEPVRRWSDNTGLHETIGRLVAVHPDHIRILKANGRHATVPFSRLSRHDQAYISTTGQRLAAEQRAARPATNDTAGL